MADGRLVHVPAVGSAAQQLGLDLTADDRTVADLESGLKRGQGYTVAEAVEDWLAKGLKGRADTTVEIVRGLTPLDAVITKGAA